MLVITSRTQWNGQDLYQLVYESARITQPKPTRPYNSDGNVQRAVYRHVVTSAQF